MRARIALRERPLLDIVDLALRFSAAHAAPFAKLSLVVLLPGFLASWAAGDLWGWWAAWIAAVVLGSFATAPFVALASKLVFADEVRVRDAIRSSMSALQRLAGIRFIELLALGLSVSCSSGLAWIYVGSVLLFTTEVAVLEGGAVGGTVTRSQRIANGNFGGASGAMFLLLVAPVAAAMLADAAGREVLGTVLEIKPPPSMFSVGGSWLAMLGWWALLPLLSVLRFFVYLDIRTRTEGWDIQTRFAEIAARAEASALPQRRAA
ncbi:MAG TPA: hypothetical protein VF765_37170 [Polyangiaceae bacterium]